MVTSGRARSVVESYWQRIWIDRDLEALDELVTDPSTRHTIDGTAVLSADSLRCRIADGLVAVRGTEFSIDGFVFEGDSAWARITLRGASIATMAPMTLTWMAQYRFDDGKITEMWALRQAGVDWTEA